MYLNYQRYLRIYHIEEECVAAPMVLSIPFPLLNSLIIIIVRLYQVKSCFLCVEYFFHLVMVVMMVFRDRLKCSQN